MVTLMLAGCLCVDPVAVLKSGALDASYKLIAELQEKNVLQEEDLKALEIGLAAKAAGIRRGCAEVIKKHSATDLMMPLATVYVRETEPSCKKTMAATLVGIVAAAKQEQPIDSKHAEAASQLLAVPDKAVANAAKDLMRDYCEQESVSDKALTWWLKNRASHYVEWSGLIFVASPSQIRDASQLGRGKVLQNLDDGVLFAIDRGKDEDQTVMLRGMTIRDDGEKTTFANRMVLVGFYHYRTVLGAPKRVREYVPADFFTKDQKLTFEVFVRLHGAGKLSKYIQE